MLHFQCMLCRAEQLAWTMAIVLVLLGALSGVASCATQAARTAEFQAAGPASADLVVAPPDYRDWSKGRVKAFLALAGARQEPPQAVLRIPALDVEAEILGDTTTRSLDLGVGHIAGTARPGEAGNVGLAGHRDGYFRRLKDVRPGQRIHLVTREGRWDYEVERVRIVEPSQVEVLAPTGHPALTLVTCYPFYFLGNAPQRFIVSARLVSPTTTTDTHTHRKDPT